MKKIVTVLLVLIMALSVFTACGKDKSALEKAGEYLYAMYKDDDKSVTPNDFEVVGVVSVDGVKYTVEWTTDNDKIKLVPNETTKMVKVDVDERSETEEKYTLTATIKDEKGKTYTVKFEHTVPQFVVSTVAQVKEMADGTDVVLSGVVVKIDTAWSDSYKNISVTLKDAAGNTILLFRLATKVELGDTLIVTGKVGSYNNAKQIAAGATAVIEVDHSAVGCTYPATGLTAVCTVCGKVNPAHTTCVDSDSNNKCDQCGKELTVTVLTIPQVLASEDGTAVVVQGVVCEIVEAWSSYNNMSYYIKDTEGNRLYIFRSKTQVEIGDTVTVTGAVGSYNNAKQIALGSTAVIDVDHSAAGCSYPTTGLTAICTVCGQVNPEHTTHTDADGNEKCDACGATVSSALNKTVDLTAQGYANEQAVTSVSDTDSVVTIAFDKGTNSNAPKFYTSGNAVRVYGGGTVTISVAEGKTISRIEITYGGSDGSNEITADVGTFSGNEWTAGDTPTDTVVLTVGGTKGNRRFASITVYYS